MTNPKSRSTPREVAYREALAAYVVEDISRMGALHVADDFPKYASRQAMTRFLAREVIFREILDVHGSIIECGVYTGAGLMAWAQLSSILEPVGGVTREVFGFDTFDGFPAISAIDQENSAEVVHAVGDLAAPGAYESIFECLRHYDENRFLSQFPKVHLIRGDFIETSSTFFTKHPHVIPALLYLDFDLYEPTRRALVVFLPRMPLGSIIAFDEVCDSTWPGETLALLESLDIKRQRLSKVGFDTKISFIQLQ